MRGKVSTSQMDRAIGALAERQYGLVSRAQLLELGLGRRAIEHRLELGRLEPVHRGVYTIGHRLLSRDGRWMAAVLACGPAPCSVTTPQRHCGDSARATGSRSPPGQRTACRNEWPCTAPRSAPTSGPGIGEYPPRRSHERCWTSVPCSNPPTCAGLSAKPSSSDSLTLSRCGTLWTATPDERALRPSGLSSTKPGLA